ncbi:MAG: DUF5107 domain-containing protein [Roseiflexaceae bacterium]|nr:DUF5107 domain-containing protein [Roseiflexaceae bacterium]
MPVQLSTEWTYRGFTAIMLENELLRVVILPQLGAKIWSIIDKRRDVELLWHHPRVAVRAAPFGAAYDDWFVGGWDELFPNDAPVEINGERYPDHGELWSLPWDWSVVEQARDEVTVALRHAGIVTATQVEKRITLRAGEPLLHIDLHIHNAGPQPLDFLWKLHPALHVTPNSRIDMPAGRVEIDPSFRARLGALESFRWPHAPLANGAQIDMRRIPPFEDQACDLYYAVELEDGWCALTDTAARAGFGLVFDKAVFNTVWVFGAYGGWRGLYTTILEPCTGYPYRLDEAIARGTASRLDAGAELRTALTAVVYHGVDSVNRLTHAGEVA